MDTRNRLLPLPREDQEQALYFRWVQMLTVDGVLVRPHCYAVPNGGKRSATEAARMVAQGVTPGIADISLDIPAGQYHGLRIEMKRIGEKPTPTQAEHIELRRSMGYQAVCCQGFDEARKTTVNYLKLRGVVIDRWAN